MIRLSTTTIQLHGTCVPKGHFEDFQLGTDPRTQALFDKHDFRASPGLAFTRLGYRKLLHENESYQRILGAVMATKTVLYIGFSFSDEYINEMRSATMSMLQMAKAEGDGMSGSKTE